MSIRAYVCARACVMFVCVNVIGYDDDDAGADDGWPWAPPPILALMVLGSPGHLAPQARLRSR
eukprot:1249423-Pyramimonas_sp.AAC.1